MNTPIYLGIIISRKLATLHELDTVYGVEDAYNLLEIISVNNANEIEMSKT